jgi:hypothetical protein
MVYIKIELTNRTKDKISNKYVKVKDLINELLQNENIKRPQHKKLQDIAIKDLLYCDSEIVDAFIDFDYNLILGITC